MKKEIIVQLNKTFEESAYSQNDVEYWMARDLQRLLDYAEWRNFLQVIEKAKTAIDKVAAWAKVSVGHKNMVAILREEFEKNEKFRNIIIEIVKENIQSAELDNSDYERLAVYPLEELPMLISGIEYGGIRYELLPYPGISKIDHLAIDLQEGKGFPEITKRLSIKAKLGLIETYAE